ncbi:Uncharacterized protein APZ42_009626, partial [Daphnia magna]
VTVTPGHFITDDEDYRIQEYVPTRYHVNTGYVKENVYEDHLPRCSTPSSEGYDHVSPLEETFWEPPSSPIQAQEDAPAHDEIEVINISDSPSETSGYHSFDSETTLPLNPAT